MIIKPELKNPGSYGVPSDVFCYKGLSIGSECQEIECVKRDAVSVQFDGVFGGSIVYLVGSNDGESYYPLHEENGNTIEAKYGGIHSVSEYVRFVKPVIQGGSKETNIKVHIYLRGV